MTAIEIIPLAAWTISGIAGTIAIWKYVSVQRRRYKKNKQYSLRQKRRYWRRIKKRTKDPGKRQYAGSRLQMIEREMKQQKRSRS